MSEEIKNENENENEDEIVESENCGASCETLFSDNATPPPKKEKRISLHTAIFAGIALVLAAVMLTYTCLSGVYKQRIAEAQSANLVSGDDRYYRGLQPQFLYIDLEEIVLSLISKDFIML